ncbi:hypothetical protein DMN91_012048 [Ooceraea biroi]|uniref:Transferrin receptor protein n=1 Tax=Ooceraea biroi TaxID=2015173 RepID=A0A3L8D8M7_OOCBI|nr:hypothetical protein DMN91_012048 [Ooceraea biroi]
MHRVLSFQMARGIDESSEYVTKRLCFSFLFSVGFLCLLCGFLLGRFAAERSMETQAQKTRAELAGNGLRNTEHLQQLALRELAEASFDRATDWQTADSIDNNARRVSGFFSNLSFVHEVSHRASCVRAIVRGSREPDRYVILSVNGDGIAVALELAGILDKIYTAHEWRPRRSLMFCVSLASEDVCPQTLPIFAQRRIVACVAVHGHPLASGYVTLSGSDIMRSIAVEAIKTIDGNWTYLEHETSGPRLPLNTPQVIFSLNESDFAHDQTRRNQSLRLRGTILAQMASQTIWRLSESTVIRWQPRYFNETVNKLLESINTDKFRDAKEKLKTTLKTLLAAVEDLNAKIDAMENIPTDLIEFRKLLHKPTDNSASTCLHEIAKCYEDASLILQER